MTDTAVVVTTGVGVVGAVGVVLIVGPVVLLVPVDVIVGVTLTVGVVTRVVDFAVDTAANVEDLGVGTGVTAEETAGDTDGDDAEVIIAMNVDVVDVTADVAVEGPALVEADETAADVPGAAVVVCAVVEVVGIEVSAEGTVGAVVVSGTVEVEGVAAEVAAVLPVAVVLGNVGVVIIEELYITTSVDVGNGVLVPLGVAVKITNTFSCFIMTVTCI